MLFIPPLSVLLLPSHYRALGGLKETSHHPHHRSKSRQDFLGASPLLFQTYPGVLAGILPFPPAVSWKRAAVSQLLPSTGLVGPIARDALSLGEPPAHRAALTEVSGTWTTSHHPQQSCLCLSLLFLPLCPLFSPWSHSVPPDHLHQLADMLPTQKFCFRTEVLRCVSACAPYLPPVLSSPCPLQFSLSSLPL